MPLVRPLRGPMWLSRPVRTQVWVFGIVLTSFVFLFLRRRATKVSLERCDALSLPVSQLALLSELDLSRCNLRVVPPSIGHCTNLRILNLAGNTQLTSLPDELAQCTQLTTLFLAGARSLTSFPMVLGKMTSLTRLGLRGNGIAHIHPESVPPNVLHLILTDNHLIQISDAVFARLTKVRKLMLANNRLESLPSAVALMQNLELIRLANNKLTSLPVELLRLPKLSWLAISGNPMSPPPPPALVPMDVHLSEVEVDMSAEGRLGSGASGEVRLGKWRGQSVAIKKFQAVTSDGRPEDEIALFAAVNHPNLCAIKAVISAPEKAILMEPLPPSLHSLGGPPTIVEITSSRYPSSASFSPFVVKRIAQGLVSALTYLHQKHIAHGDIYAHNTLANDEGTEVRLCDFGAAFSYVGTPLDSNLIEKIEVRAFGVLLGDLVSRFSPPDQNEPSHLRTELEEMARRCIDDAHLRPSFAMLQTQLQRID